MSELEELDDEFRVSERFNIPHKRPKPINRNAQIRMAQGQWLTQSRKIQEKRSNEKSSS